MNSEKEYVVSCGNYRSFVVVANSKKQATQRFNDVEPAGFTQADITKIMEKKGGDEF